MGSKDLLLTDSGRALYEHWRSLEGFLVVWGAQQEEILKSSLTSHFDISSDGTAVRASERLEERPPLALSQSPPEAPGKKSVSIVDTVGVHLVFQEEHRQLDANAGTLDLATDALRPAAPGSNGPPRQMSSDSCGSSDSDSDDVPKKEISTHSSKIRKNKTFSFIRRDSVHSVKETMVKLLKAHGQTYITQAVILANVCVIAADCDYSIEHKGKTNSLLKLFELVFAVFYVLEVILRIAIERREFFCGEGCGWNAFDSFLALQAAYEQIVLLTGEGGSLNMSVLRLLRLLKMLRLFRVIRSLSHFRELRLMILAFSGSAKSLLWAFLLVFMTSVVFAMCILQVVANRVGMGEIDAETSVGIEKYWSSVGTAMLSLFMATMGGADWEHLAKPLQKIGWHAYTIMLLYIFISAYAIVNIMNSIFIQAMVEQAEHDDKLVLEMELQRKDYYVHTFRSLHGNIDEDQDGTISLSEFETALTNPGMMAFFSHLNIDVSDAKLLFDCLSRHGRDEVDDESFIYGCMKLKGDAKSMDLQALRTDHRTFCREARRHFAKVDKTLNTTFEERISTSISKQMYSLQALLQHMARRLDDAAISQQRLRADGRLSL